MWLVEILTAKAAVVAPGERVEQRGVYNVLMFYVEGGTPSIYSRGVTLVSECIVNRWITCMDA